jgi:hypothetical protein
MNLKNIFILISISIAFHNVAAQQTPVDGWNHGSDQLKITVKSLEKIFLNPTKVKQFENSLGKYQRLVDQTDTTRYLNETPMKIEMPYSLEKKGNQFSRILLTYDSSQFISSIYFILEEDNIDINKLASFLNETIKAGYKYNLRWTRFYSAFKPDRGRTIYYNSVKKVRISITPINEFKTAIEFTK